MLAYRTYWLCSPTGKADHKGAPQALYSKTESYLQKNKNRLNPIDYIKDAIEQRMQKHLAGESTTFILGGDFNGGEVGVGTNMGVQQ